MSKKHAEARPPLNEWVVHIHGSTKQLAIASSRMLRDQYGGYTFTGPDGVIADFPPGTVQYVTRKPPPPRVPAGGSGSTITATGGTITGGGGAGGNGGTGATGTGGTSAHGAGGGGGTGAAA